MTSTLLNSVTFQNCILKDKWKKAVPTTNIQTRKSFYDIFKDFVSFNRNIENKMKYGGDCLYYAKKTPVNVPTDCYWKTMPADKVERRYSWELFKFWHTYGPDLLYTFDFVLYDEINVIDNQNKLWFLIAYLKVITKLVDNPLDIVALVQERTIYRKLYLQTKARIDNLERIVAHLFDNKQVLVENNIKIKDNPQVHTLLTLLSESNKTGKHNELISNLDKESKGEEIKSNKNIIVKPLFSFY